MQKSRQLWLTCSIFVFGMFACGLLSICLGKELQWDLAAYHFYNPYAFLHQRDQIDYWPPSAIQMFLSPTIDLLGYFLIKHFTPITTEFFLGALHGINVGLLFCIARNLLANYVKNTVPLTATCFFVAFLGMYAPTVLPSIGGFFNDNVVSIFVLVFVWMLLHYLSNSLQPKPIILAFLVLGIAMGLKLTAAIYAIGALLALMVIVKKTGDERANFHWLIFAIFGLTLGLVLANGYWMWHLWQQYRNPFFPFYNKIFHSPFFPAINWQDKRFMPENWQQWLLFPFYFSTWRKATTELYSADYRFVMIYILLIAFGVRFLFGKKTHSVKFIWFCSFFIFSYLAWEINFSILRYSSVLQMLAPVLIVLLICELLNTSIQRIAALASIFIFIFLTMHPMGVERVYAEGNDYFNVTIPAEIQTIDNATVLMPYAEFTARNRPNPNQYLIPFFPPHWRFGGVGFNRQGYIITPGLQDFMSHATEEIFILAAENDMAKMYKVSEELNLHPANECFFITSDRQRLSQEKVMLCRLIR